MQAFDWKLNLVAEGAENTSILATIASPIGVLLVPIVGISAWQLAAAAVTGFIAKENVVGTLAVCYALTDFIDTEELALVGGAGEVATVMGLTKAAALAFLMFNLFSPPCFAAMGAMNSEMKSAKWFWAGIALQLATGYTVAFWVYQIGTFITTGKVGAGFLPGFVAVLLFAMIIVGLIQRTKNRLKEEAAQKAA
jgi:ferrous iron transport protein B